MLVWKDKRGTGKRRRPEWDDDEYLVSMEGEGGYLWTAPKYAECLGPRPGVTWHDCGGDWECALYSELEPNQYIRPLSCCLYLPVIDVGGIIWPLPALFHPTGEPAIGMYHKAEIVDGALAWTQQAPTPRLARAIDAAGAMRPFALKEWEGVDQGQMLDAMLAVIEASFCISAQSAAVLGIIGTTLLDKGLSAVSGVIDPETLAPYVPPGHSEEANDGL